MIEIVNPEIWCYWLYSTFQKWSNSTHWDNHHNYLRENIPKISELLKILTVHSGKLLKQQDGNKEEIRKSIQ